MSELKVYGFCCIGDFKYQGTDRGQSSNEMHPYYSKSEADKFISDLEESHKKEVGQLLIEIAELKEKHKTEVKELLCLIRDNERKCSAKAEEYK